MEQPNRREFVRAKVSLPARVRVLEGKELELVRDGLGVSLFRGADHPDPLEEFTTMMPTGPQTEILYRLFQNLNNKLDFIIEQLTLATDRTSPSFKEVVELSGSGFKFISEEPLPQGAYLKVDLLIPSTVQFRIELIAEVIRSEPAQQDDGQVMVARIVDIDEASRDAIIESVFKKQRKVIREKKAHRRNNSE